MEQAGKYHKQESPLDRNFSRKQQQLARSLRKYRLPPVSTGIILGSGLGGFADSIKGLTIPYSAIRGFPGATVPGHSGCLKVGSGVAVCAGRFHLYEGHSPTDVVLPVFLLHSLGVKTLILTNAAGGINPAFTPGDLVLIKDQLNLTGINPLSGPNPAHLGPRFPDSSAIYSPRLRNLAGAQNFLQLKQGVYAAMPGPSYETPAEIRMLRIMGADLVGMSTVHEALAAAYLGMEVLGISCITNMAAGIGRTALNHEEVLATGKQAAAALSRLLRHILTTLGCPLQDAP